MKDNLTMEFMMVRDGRADGMYQVPSIYSRYIETCPADIEDRTRKKLVSHFLLWLFLMRVW